MYNSIANMKEKTNKVVAFFKKPGFAFFWPAFLMAIIFTLSACPAEKSDQQSGFLVNIVTSVFPSITDIDLTTTIIRKTAHFLEYALLGFLLARAYAKNVKFAKNSSKMTILAVITSALYSTGDEIHQAFVPGRSCEFRDICIDTIGALLGASIYYLIYKKRANKVEKTQEESL